MVNQNALYAKQYLMKKYRYSDAQASGIVGNLMQESSLNTGALNRGDGSDGSNSVGIAQWNGARARGLNSFVNDQRKGGTYQNDLDSQLDYVHHELNTSEKAAGDRLRAATSVGDATSAIIGYERPQGWKADNPTGGHGWNNRLKYATTLFGGDPSEAIQQVAQTSPAQSQNIPVQQPPVIAQATPETKPESRNGILVDAYNKITGQNVQIGDKIFGMDTNKFDTAASGLGDFAKQIAEQDQALNSQMAANARAAGGRSSSPVELQLMTSYQQRKKKKGGLSGLGGYAV